MKVDIRDILRALCKYKEVEIAEGHLMPDHIHMLVTTKYAVADFMGHLKRKSALMIFGRHKVTLEMNALMVLRKTGS